jgi:hypothetical protein
MELTALHQGVIKSGGTSFSDEAQLLAVPSPPWGRGWPGRAGRGRRSMRRESAGNFETVTLKP